MHRNPCRYAFNAAMCKIASANTDVNNDVNE